MNKNVINLRLARLVASKVFTPEFHKAFLASVNAHAPDYFGPDTTPPLDPMQAPVPVQEVSGNGPSAANSGSVTPLMTNSEKLGSSSGAVLEGKAKAHEENRNKGTEGFSGYYQTSPNGETERGRLPQASRESLPTSTIQSVPPIDRNTPITTDGMAQSRAYKAAPRRSVYLTSPK